MSSIHSKRYHDTVEASKKKRDRILKKLGEKHEKMIEPARTKFTAAKTKGLRVYERIRNPAWRAFEEGIAPAKEEFRLARETADALKDREKRKAEREHTKVRKAALEKFERATGSRWP